MKRINGVFCALLSGILALPAEAQLPAGLDLAIEVTPVLGVSTAGFAGSHPGPGAGTGYGVAVGGTLGVGSALAVYGGYQYLQFACDVCGEGGLDDDLRDVGWEVGLQAAIPLGGFPVRPWVRAGALLHQLQFSGGGELAASEPAVGFSVGAGTDLPLVGPVTLVPALRYRSYSADFNFEGIPVGTESSTRSTAVSYVTVDLGLAYRF